ncbi:MAG: hypothetical protein K2Q25_02310 [Mycobacteriaceae bacterium]|nr:hypothetical protein [Mycobacteriaceae bacterium]
MTNTTRHTTIHTVTAAACLGWTAASLTCGNLTETLAGLTAATTAWAAAAWRDKQTRHRHHMKTGRETVWTRRETEPRVDRGRLYTTDIFGPIAKGIITRKPPRPALATPNTTNQTR